MNDHSWWWIGLLNELANKDVDFITSTLTNYSHGKTSYSSPDEFLSTCVDHQLPDKRCDFIGGPADNFSTMPAHVMRVLKRLGMNETSKVLEVGFGLGRNAKSIIDFLDKNKYCAIEPNGDMMAVGVAHMIGTKVIEEKQPMFSTNTNFDFGVFIQKSGNEMTQQLFDVVTSRSVWTHTSKVQIQQYLASFAKYTNPNAFLATSVIIVTENCSHDYNGTEWVGKSHDANDGGIVVHCMPWLRKVCKAEGLVVQSLVEEVPDFIHEDTLGQPWVVIRHDLSHISDHVS